MTCIRHETRSVAAITCFPGFRDAISALRIYFTCRTAITGDRITIITCFISTNDPITAAGFDTAIPRTRACTVVGVAIITDFACKRINDPITTNNSRAVSITTRRTLTSGITILRPQQQLTIGANIPRASKRVTAKSPSTSHTSIFIGLVTIITYFACKRINNPITTNDSRAIFITSPSLATGPHPIPIAFFLCAPYIAITARCIHAGIQTCICIIGILIITFFGTVSLSIPTAQQRTVRLASACVTITITCITTLSRIDNAISTARLFTIAPARICTKIGIIDAIIALLAMTRVDMGIPTKTGLPGDRDTLRITNGTGTVPVVARFGLCIAVITGLPRSAVDDGVPASTVEALDSTGCRLPASITLFSRVQSPVSTIDQRTASCTRALHIIVIITIVTGLTNIDNTIPTSHFTSRIRRIFFTRHTPRAVHIAIIIPRTVHMRRVAAITLKIFLPDTALKKQGQQKP
jgi:hypothetical protein